MSAREQQDAELAKLRQAATEYFYARHRLATARAELERQHAIVKQTDAELEQLKRFLEASVEPRCGSASKPPRRLYGFPIAGKAVVIEWDAELRRAAVRVEEMELAK